MISLSHWGMFETELVDADRMWSYPAQQIEFANLGQKAPWAASSYNSQLANSAQAAINAYYQHNRFGTLD